MGFTEEALNANFDGNIRSIGFGGYDYQNIIIKGDFKKRLFNGLVSIDGSNIKLEYLKGSIDFSGKDPHFAFDANLEKASLKKLKLTLGDFDLTGHFNINFTGSNIDQVFRYCQDNGSKPSTMVARFLLIH